MELYETEVLKQIGESIGRVLRIDTHTAMEAKGRYARLCIQLDINKPLINTVLIGRYEQPVVYEGLYKLCFSHGRIGHRKEACLFTIKRPKTLVEGGPVKNGADNVIYQGANLRGVHDSSCIEPGSGTMEDRDAGTEDDRYLRWMLLTRRKSEQKRTNNSITSGDHSSHGLGQTSHGPRQESNGEIRGWIETKRNDETIWAIECGPRVKPCCEKGG